MKTTPQEIGPPKWPIIHIGGLRKKAKAHKQILKYTITKDDVDLVIERVKGHTIDENEEDVNHRGRIRNELANIK